MELKNKSTKELWQDAIKYLSENGEPFRDQNNRICKEVLGLSLILTEFRDVSAPIEILSRSKDWVYPRINEIESIIIEGNLAKSYVYSYGERIFSYSKDNINQIDSYILPLLKNDPFSRRGVITLWNPESDSKLKSSAVPGLVLIDFKVRNKELFIHSIIRSNDIFIGWPANIYQLYVIGNYVAEKLNISLGAITTFSTSAHFFEDNQKKIKEIFNI